MKIPSLLLVTIPVLSSCLESGQDRTSVPLYLAGTTIIGPILAAGDVELVIDRADLAFGPLYLCAGNTAGDLCDTARLEWLDAVTVDTTQAEPVRVGDLTGTTGPVASWMYDLGISSQLTQSDPIVLPAAIALGNASFVVEGRAQVGDVELPFSATVPIQQTGDTELGVPVVRKSASSRFFRDITTDGTALLITFNPEVWLNRMDFRRYVTNEQCTPTTAASTICDGATERVCDGQGQELTSTDCDAQGQICLPDQGCVDRFVLNKDTAIFRSIRNALLIGQRPSFEWVSMP